MTRVSSCASPEPSGTSVSPGWSRATAPLFFSETGIGQDKIQLRQSVNPGPAPCCSQVPLLWCLCSRREISTPSSSRRRRQMSSVGAAPARRRGHGSSLLAPPPVGARRDAGVRAAPARPAVYVYPRLLQRDRRLQLREFGSGLPGGRVNLCHCAPVAVSLAARRTVQRGTSCPRAASTDLHRAAFASRYAFARSS